MKPSLRKIRRERKMHRRMIWAGRMFRVPHRMLYARDARVLAAYSHAEEVINLFNSFNHIIELTDEERKRIEYMTENKLVGWFHEKKQE